MPKDRLKRPRDPAQLAKLMIDIASGEVEDRAKPADESWTACCWNDSLDIIGKPRSNI